MSFDDSVLATFAEIRARAAADKSNKDAEAAIRGRTVTAAMDKIVQVLDVIAGQTPINLGMKFHRATGAVYEVTAKTASTEFRLTLRAEITDRMHYWIDIENRYADNEILHKVYDEGEEDRFLRKVMVCIAHFEQNKTFYGVRYDD